MKVLKQQYSEIKNLILTNIQVFKEQLTSIVKADMKLTREVNEMGESMSAIGKLIYAFRADYYDANKTRPEYAGKSLVDALHTFLGIPKGKNTLNRGHSCANAFRCVVKGWITEVVYDAVSVDALCALSEIITKVNDDLDHQAVKDACVILSGPSEKKAKAIRDEVKSRLDTKGENEDAEVVYLTPEQVKEAKANTDRLNATEIVSKVDIEILMAEVESRARTTADENVARFIVEMVAGLPAAFAANKSEQGFVRFPAATLKAWSDEAAATHSAVAGVNVGDPLAVAETDEQKLARLQAEVTA